LKRIARYRILTVLIMIAAAALLSLAAQPWTVGLHAAGSFQSRPQQIFRATGTSGPTESSGRAGAFIPAAGGSTLTVRLCTSVIDERNK
jgi:hypothetical protein